MFSIHNILSISLLLITLTSSVSATSQETEQDLETFQKLLNQVDPPSLHEALHSISPKKYKHGAFQEDRTAVEVIHKEEPSVATRIVKLATRQDVEVIDLSKRQAPDISNGTTPTNTPPAPNPQTSTRVTPVPQNPQSSTSALVQTTEGSATLPAVNTPTTAPSVATSSNGAPVSSPSVAATTSAGAITSSSPATSPISLTAGEVITTTNAAGLTIISTVGGGASTVFPSSKGVTSTNTHKAAAQTSVVVQTSTLPNGSQSVVTAVTVVGAGAGGGAGETPSGNAGVGATTTSSSPGLQTGEAVMTRGWGKEMVVIVGGAVVFAGFM